MPNNQFIHLIFFQDISNKIDMLRYFLNWNFYQNSLLQLKLNFQRCWLNGSLASENVSCLTYIIGKLVLLIVKKDSQYVWMWFNPLFLAYIGQFAWQIGHIHSDNSTNLPYYVMNYYKNAIDLNVKCSTNFKMLVGCVGFTHIDFET